MSALIRSNTLRLVVLLWFAGWLLLVMPGHKRGIVTLPGAGAEQVKAQACCDPQAPTCCEPAAPDPAADCCGSGSDGRPPKPVDPAKHCAICFLKAHLTDPPPLVLYTPYLGALDELEFLVEHTLAQPKAAPERSRGRAPPLA